MGKSDLAECLEKNWIVSAVTQVLVRPPVVFSFVGLTHIAGC